ncbi:MAG: hypothetical protein LUF92_02360 [Clostridiales bacterium]|nr:hypothetical protein [Clostridiales bacterium]
MKATGWLVKDDTKSDKVVDSKHLKYIGRAKNFLPSTAVVEIVQEIERMARMAKNNLIRSMRAVMDNDLHYEAKMEKCEETIDYLSSEITDYLVEVNQYELPLSDASRIGALFHTVIDLERIGDHAMNILENAQKKQKHNLEFTDVARGELTEMFDKVLELYDKCLVMFTTGDKSGIDEIIALENEIDQMDIDLQKKQVRRLSKEQCSVEAGLIYTDLVIGLERIADHATNIAYSIFNDNPEDSLE